MSVRKLEKDENVKSTTAIDGKKAVVVFTARASETSGDRYAITTTLDFGNVSPDDVLRLACRNAIIDLQRQWRATAIKDMRAATAADAYDSPIDVQKAIIETAPRANPAVAAKAKLEAANAELETLRAELASMKATARPATKVAKAA